MFQVEHVSVTLCFPRASPVQLAVYNSRNGQSTEAVMNEESDAFNDEVVTPQPDPSKPQWREWMARSRYSGMARTRTVKASRGLTTISCRTSSSVNDAAFNAGRN